MVGGGEGYSPADIRQLLRIRRLQEDLGLDLPAVEVVLHMRRQMLDLLAQLDDVERRKRQRERELLAEIQRLRRYLAEGSEWSW
jgi:DNA-binding transcriptional MerR regulator